VRVNMWRKFVITTVVALFFYGFYYWLTIHSGVSLDDLPFMPELPKV
jgi:predicted secreted protein